MSKTEILAELPNLKADELAEVQAKLDELAGETWCDDGELTETDNAALDTALIDYQQSQHSGDSWDQVKARIQAKLSGRSRTTDKTTFPVACGIAR
jgi:polyhydroxyalkanoate synthesis regulator phasin